MRLILLLILLILTAQISSAQLSVKYPQICHNKDKYLKCINDGNHLLNFKNGEFIEFRTSDSLVKYSNQYKTFTFLKKVFTTNEHIDTVSIRLLKNSILFRKGNELVEIDSLSKLVNVIHTYYVGNIMSDGRIIGMAFYVGDKYFEIKVSTFYKNWSWDISMKESTRDIHFMYSGYKRNRMDKIYIRDESLRYGLVISHSFRTLKKLWSLESLYVDTVNVRGLTSRTNIIPPDQNFMFDYKKSGKLKSVQYKGELKFCDCE